MKTILDYSLARELIQHKGHKIKLSEYEGEPDPEGDDYGCTGITILCLDCNEILLSIEE